MPPSTSFDGERRVILLDIVAFLGYIYGLAARKDLRSVFLPGGYDEIESFKGEASKLKAEDVRRLRNLHTPHGPRIAAFAEAPCASRLLPSFHIHCDLLA